MAKILIAASGTGGHIFPALAVASVVSKNCKIYWLGVPNRIENEIIPKAYTLYTISIGGLHGHGLVKILQLLKLLWSSVAVYKIIHRDRIEAVFSTGGYIAAPVILASYWYGIPMVLHESNAIPGKVTRLLGWACTRVAVSLPAAARLPSITAQLTGTPIRKSFFKPQIFPSWIPIYQGPLVVVIGGSQGSLGLNLMIRPLIPRLLRSGCRVVHITGKNDLSIGQLQHPFFVELPFSSEMPALLQYADLIIARAGASSLSELAISKTPTIFIPFPQATDNHQAANASCAAELGAAIIVWQHNQSSKTLISTLWRLLGPRLRKTDHILDPLHVMKNNMERLAISDANEQLSSILIDLS
uniref:Undecaprenyl-PP-MurNAc-pentapeptide-UDPGlcNAc GlcNAc transferase n=1 Tax=Paulinella chromatophora TaxID=39717 RepID=B1X4C4_PAUCH|nr:Undecaprenyl-PP-MurNAc-pentapeptide-UDPGlcNAc GlcNAc transferase [Paulinella chromatophora]ACB42793.1 Undecaprenyl-PP-MurNAc-pentapeptide-UDPGlcNAc GlcNAc transferase [Paulinella chromatophora]|eukprot:gb/GEZN01010014.1/.p1 GENE.gb/GEZN01010014.1/~~gb/GEZN01010014.1/.p1  ORF type:complete len:357 (+),score=-26.13 gb/GEZN01010014.1/:72-1142(+)